MLLLLLAVFLFSPAQSQTYCTPGPTTTVDGNLGLVVFKGDTKIFSNAYDCPGRIGLQDLTNLWADIHPNGTYWLLYNVSTCGNVFPAVSGAWIDFDQNGSFDATESLFTFNRSNGLINTTFRIAPTTAIKFGMTRMRVQVQETSSPNPLDPCSRFAYGGTKDFNISITNSTNPFDRCNSGPTSSTDGNLGPVTLKGDTLTINDTLGCPGRIGPIDETTQVADLTPGGQYAITYDVSTCGAVYDSVTTAWIDYNGNNLLEEGERIIPYSNKYGKNTVSFKVPSNNTTIGKVWMRVQMQESNAASISPCTIFPYGGTKDFSIVLAASFCNSGPTTLGSFALGPVFLQGATSKIDETSSCPGAVGPIIFTNQSADLVQGQAWTLNYQVAICSGDPSYTSAAWIDYNQNGKFEAWEQITPLSNRAADTFQFKVPISTPDETVKSGATRLRVQVQQDVSTKLDPCAEFRHGGTKDFSVQIVTSSTAEQKLQS